jgi:hypothetical protein
MIFSCRIPNPHMNAYPHMNANPNMNTNPHINTGIINNKTDDIFLQDSSVGTDSKMLKSITQAVSAML